MALRVCYTIYVERVWKRMYGEESMIGNVWGRFYGRECMAKIVY